MFYYGDMMSEKIISKYQKLYYDSWTNSGYYPAKNSEYEFAEIPWNMGVAMDVDTTTRRIKSRQLFSITKNNYDWNERKIIHKIDIEFRKNYGDQYFDDAVQYSLLRVKKTIFDNNDASKLADTSYWSVPQLIVDPTNSFFCKSVTFDNLNYNLSADDDLILIQNVKFKFGYHLTNGIRWGKATKPFANYCISILYSYGDI